MAVVFDTLKFANKLKAAGIPDQQAEAIAQAFQEASGEAEIATKRDVERLEAKIERMEIELKAEIGKLASEVGTLKWLASLIGVGVLTLILKAFFGG